MNRFIKLVLCIFILLGFSTIPTIADDLEFSSFDEARAAAERRGEEYDKKMMEYVDLQKQWDNDNNSGVKTGGGKEIIDHRLNEGSTGTEAGQAIKSDTEQRIEDLKSKLLNTGSTAVAGATAAYQWSVKFKNGKWVLSDSYSAASFNTGATDEPTTPPTNTPTTPTQPVNPTQPTQPVTPTNDPVVINIVAPVNPNNPINPNNPVDPDKPIIPHTYADVDTSLEPEKDTTQTDEPKPTEGYTVGAPVVPAPAVRLIIQHPIDQIEEIFSCDADPSAPVDLSLDDFTIPEDTRVRMNLELGESINPDDVYMIVVDDEGETSPIPYARFANYRHLFRIPSPDQYSVKIFLKDTENHGDFVQIMQVAVPVTPVDFDSRSIESTK